MLFVAWVCTTACAATTYLLFQDLWIAIVASYGILTVVLLGHAMQVLRAKRRVLEERNVPILWGAARVIAWDPVEGALFLRDKGISFVDDCLEDGKGGIRCIYPMLGDELALQVPLEIQTLKFADDKVLTREYLSVTIRGSIKWQVTDLKKYYLLVSRDLRSTGELADRLKRPGITPAPEGAMPPLGDTSRTQGKLMAAAIEWLRMLAEEEARTVVSRVSSGLLIAERMTDGARDVAGKPQTEFERLGMIPAAVEGGQTAWRSASESLAESIARALTNGVKDSGISIVSVSLQEIQMPEEIVVKCIEAAQAAYLPLLAQRGASVRRAELSAEVETIGREAVGAREMLAAAPPFALVDFLSQFVTKQLSTASAASIATAGLLATERPVGAPPPRISSEG